MSRNGSGTYQLPAGNPVVPSTVISSTWANTTLSDIGTALTQSIANDGQTTPVANLPMATFRHTNVGNAVARNDYAAAGQVQDSSLQWLTSVAGTNTITASVTPSPTVYVAGQTFRFVSAGANTGATTLNINGLGAKNVTKRGTVALASGDIPSGVVIEVVYDGTQFQMQTVGRGQYIGTQVFTANGTYTPTAGVTLVEVEVVAGGGGGGGALATAAGQFSIGAGGGAGAYCRGLISSPVAGAIVIGAGGAGAAGAVGATGGSSGYQGLIVAAGGVGGNVGPAAATSTANGGSGGAASTPGNIVNTTGSPGHPGWANTANVQGVTGMGASSIYGAGGINAATGNIAGSNGLGFGAGASGAFNLASQAARAGGAGSAGIILIHEYV